MFGDAKVQNFDGAARDDKNVRRLDVAVDDELGMRRAQAFGHLHRDVEDKKRIATALRQALFERLALEQLHDDEGPAPALAKVVDRADVGMAE